MMGLSPLMIFSLGLLAAGVAAILGFFAIDALDNRRRPDRRPPPAE